MNSKGYLYLLVKQHPFEYHSVIYTMIEMYGSTWIVNETKYNLCLQVSCTDKLKFRAI